MKNSILFFCSLLLITSSMLINFSCVPDRPSRPPINRFPYLPPPPTFYPNQSIWVDAMMNIKIERPMNFAILSGSVTGAAMRGARIRWEQISGPAGCIIENPDSVISKVSDLVIGSYQFKLTATTISGETMSDTMTLNVQEATSFSNQIFFSNLDWVCPFGCSIYLGYSLSFIPAVSPITVYIKRENSSIWERVVPDSVFTTERYFYNRGDGQLCIFENLYIEATDHPEIKIVF